MPDRRKEEERRRSPRFNCGGHAKISLLPSDGIFIPGRVLDLSMSGCRIDTHMAMDCGARAEIIVRMNSAAFRAVGEVRAIRGGSGAGVEFVYLSTAGREMLRDLVAQLAKVQAALDRLSAERCEMDEEFIRKQLEKGELQAALFRLGTRVPFLETTESSEGKKSEAGKEEPLVIPVNLFG